MEKDEALAARLKVRQEAQLKLSEAHLKQQLKEMQEGATSEECLRHVEYKVGDIVLLYSPSVPVGVSAKLFPSWRGPYFIVRRTGAYNYDIANRKKEHSSVHVRRLVKYDPYLLEHESVLDALKRVQKDFWVQRKPDVAMGQEEKALVEYNTEKDKDLSGKKRKAPAAKPGKDEKKSETGQSAENAVRVDLLVSESDISDAQPKRKRRSPRLRGKEGKERKGEETEDVRINPRYTPKVGEFYLMRINHPHFKGEELEKTFWLVEITDASHKEVVGHLWRSKWGFNHPSRRRYLPVYWDHSRDMEDWRYDVEDDERYVPYTYQVDKPRQLINFPFQLDEEKRIPIKVWDLVDELGVDKHLVGRAPTSKYVRAKK
jgi:hypothetical protein